MHRFVRKAVLPLVIGAAALAGLFAAVSSGGAQDPQADQSVQAMTAQDISWT
jgi:hypothetical protein